MSDASSPDERLPLLTELRWFVRLRWFAGTSLLLGATAYGAWQGWTIPTLSVVALGLAIIAYNVPLAMLSRHREDGPPQASSILANAWTQVLLDLAALTLLTTWTGGFSSLALGLFALHMVFASLLLSARSAYLVAMLALIMLASSLGAFDRWPDSTEAPTAMGWFASLLLIVFITNHITETLRRREGELRSQHQRTRGILDTAVDGIITIDDRGVISSVNPAARSIFGYEESEMVGRNVRVLMPTPAEGVHDDYIARYLRTGEKRILQSGRELIGQRKDGSHFHMELAVSEVHIGDERTFTGLVRDITERKRSEAELRELNETLRRQQQALIQHEKMAAMGQMAAGVAHEISNPLASMDSLLQLIQRRPERIQEETAGVLREQVARIERVVRQMKDFAHPNETEWADVQLNDLVDGALGMVRFDHRTRRVDVVRSFQDDAGTVHVMPHAIQQVLVNLILNALDAMASSGKPRLVVATKRFEEWCVIEVLDNGKGIPEKDLPHVFEPFFTTKPVGQGTGLGLSISYSLVERHGGRIEVQSSASEGTRFSIYLALARFTSSERERMEHPIPETENPAN